MGNRQRTTGKAQSSASIVHCQLSIDPANVTKKLLLAAPNYSFYFAGKGIGLFYLLAFVHLLEHECGEM